MSSCKTAFAGRTLSSRWLPVGDSLRTRTVSVTMQKGGTIKFSPNPKETRDAGGKV